MKKILFAALGAIVILAAALAGLSKPLFIAHADTQPSPSTQGATATPRPPTTLTVHNDDHLATVTWQAPADPSVVGYKVTWGPIGSLTRSFFTDYTTGQIQPLVDGQTYQVEVQSVDGNGRLSAPLGPASTQTDPSYVNSLRATMTGQFDDFNDSGPIDPTHWSVSYANAGPGTRAFAFNEQGHLHMFTRNILPVNDSALRADATMRAQRPFDIIGRTGTVAFDFDWGAPPRPIDGLLSDRYNWYLVFSPMLTDDVSFRANMPGVSGHVIYPLDALILQMKASRIQFERVVNGQIVQTWANSAVPASLQTVNVRKHSVVTISQTAATLTIAGTRVLTAQGIHLDFTTGYLYNEQLVYQTTHDHIPAVLSHWDNIGFDAPAGYAPDSIRTYADGTLDSDQHLAPASFTVTIPDSLTGEKAERLFLDVQTNRAGVQANVAVNGHAVTWAALPIWDTQSYDAHVLTLPLGTLHRGVNTISVSTSCGCLFRIENVHVEVAFPFGSAAPYAAAPDTGSASIPPVAPMPSFGTNAPASGTTVSGIVNVEVQADGSYALLPTGHVNPVTQLTLMVDGRPATTYTLPAPTVATDQVLLLDTTRLTNGQHTLTVTAYGMDGNADGTVASLNSNDPLLSNPLPPSMQTCIRTIIVTN